MNQQYSRTEKILNGVLLGSVAMNLIISFFLAQDVLPAQSFTLRFAGGFFLLVFVWVHGAQRYGQHKMLIFFCLTLAITWTAESLSIGTGIPFGKYYYTDMLGEKIGNVPVMIIPAYFFNGYLAWTMGNLFVGSSGRSGITATREMGINRSNVFLVPFVSSLIMVMWNVCFEPVMSTIEGNWHWLEAGPYHGVPISNFLGWLMITFLVFQSFAIFLLKSGDQALFAIRPAHWYLVPVMYMVQGLPSLLYPFFRVDHAGIYQPTALITLLTMFLAAVLNMIVINRRLAKQENPE